MRSAMIRFIASVTTNIFMFDLRMKSLRWQNVDKVLGDEFLLPPGQSGHSVISGRC